MVNTTNQHLSSALWQCLWHDQPVESDCALSSVLCVFPGCRKKWKIDKVGTPQDRLWKLKDKDEKKTTHLGFYMDLINIFLLVFNPLANHLGYNCVHIKYLLFEMFFVFNISFIFNIFETNWSIKLMA